MRLGGLHDDVLLQLKHFMNMNALMSLKRTHEGKGGLAVVENLINLRGGGTVGQPNFWGDFLDKLHH